MNDKGITIVGGVPNPVGGVTNFIKRLISKYPDKFGELLDIYPDDDKVKVPISHIVYNKKYSIKFILKLIFCRSSNIFFNFSTVNSLTLLFIIPKLFDGKRWLLVLHNGDLHIDGKFRFTSIAVVRKALKKVDKVGYLSSLQRNFYIENGVPSTKLYKVSSYVPIDVDTVKPLDQFSLDVFSEWLKEGLKIFIVSGYPTKIYQHLAVMDLFEKMYRGGTPNIRLALFLYGDDSDGDLQIIKNRCKSSDIFAFYWSQPEDVFLSALKRSSGYIRMNTVDSFGIAVADAVNLKIPVIASNVCDRYVGANVVDFLNFSAVENFINREIKNKFSEADKIMDSDNNCGDLINDFLFGGR